MVILLLIVIIATGILVIRITRKPYLVISESSQMPDIVFMSGISYREVRDEGEVLYEIAFCDKNGNFYTSSAPDVCYLYYQELVNEYAAGNLQDKIEYVRTCDADKVFENYQKLCEVSCNEELEIIYPEAVPAVQSEKKKWYGIYYDNKGELQRIILQEQEATRYEANDDRANEIYKWYVRTLGAVK